MIFCRGVLSRFNLLSGSFLVRPQKSCERRSAFVLRPIRRRALPEQVLRIRIHTMRQEKPDNFLMTPQGGLVQGRGVRVSADGIEGAWILPGIEQHAHDLDGTELRCKRQRPVTVVVA